MKQKKPAPEQKHEFALYIPDLSKTKIKTDTIVIFDDPKVVHRIASVLRLSPPEELIIFDRNMHARVRLASVVPKKNVQVRVGAVAFNKPLQPVIDFILPVLKREDLERAIYSLTALGTAHIQLVHTEKTQTAWRGAKELDRLQRIASAAAEQSKQFVVPVIKPPVAFEQAVASAGSPALFFDPEGLPLFDVVMALREKRPEKITVLVGPEGDLTEDEKALLQHQGVQLCRLTPTVLRAQQACTVGLGALRSLLS